MGYIKVDLEETGWAGMMGRCEYGDEPSGCTQDRTCLTGWAPTGCWTKTAVHAVAVGAAVCPHDNIRGLGVQLVPDRTDGSEQNSSSMRAHRRAPPCTLNLATSSTGPRRGRPPAPYHLQMDESL